MRRQAQGMREALTPTLSPQAGRGSRAASAAPAQVHYAGLQLDLAVEAVDQRAPLRVEFVPVDRADLGEIVLGFGDRERDRAFELHLRIGRDDVVWRLEHLRDRKSV